MTFAHRDSHHGNFNVLGAKHEWHDNCGVR